jgi:putative ABC transport system permease protein
MNFIKRAWLATKAKKGRTGLLILVTSAILIFVLAGLTIKNAADSAVKNAKKQAGATVTLSVNREAMMKAFKPDSNNSSDSSSDTSATTSVDLATAKSIAEKSDVASYLFTTTTTATAGDDITAISTSSTSSSSDESSNSNSQPAGPGMMVSGDFTITGVNSTDKVSDFTSGTNKISKGTGITEDTADNSALISADLAKENNLSIGDSFTVKTTVNDTETSYTLKIVGIYDNSSTATTAQMMSNASNPQNNIYTNLTTANTMKGESDKLDSAIYTLSNPEKMDDFVKEVKSEIDTDSYSVTSSDEIYEQMLSPLNNISSIAKTTAGWFVILGF